MIFVSIFFVLLCILVYNFVLILFMLFYYRLLHILEDGWQGLSGLRGCRLDTSEGNNSLDHLHVVAGGIQVRRPR